MTKLVRFKLNHNCGIKGAEGNDGDIIETTEELAQKLLSRKGGKLVGDDDDAKLPGKSLAEPQFADMVEHVTKLTQAVSRDSTQLELFRNEIADLKKELAQQGELIEALGKDLLSLKTPAEETPPATADEKKATGKTK